MLAATLLAAGLVVITGLANAKAPILNPDKLLILSTTDVKGKTGPCGCHIPKGGLSRRATYVDSIRTVYGQVLLVDNGGFFPEDAEHKDAAPFLIGAMKALGTDVVNVGEGDLHFGLAYLTGRASAAALPVISSNLLDKQTHQPIFKPYLIKKVGDVSVGMFGLMNPKGDLGPAHDSIEVQDPMTVAPAMVRELRAKGAQVVVLLSQLGKIEGEDLVAGVEGIDAVVMGHNASLMQRGRMVKNTVACYGGDQGHYVCRTDVTLDPHGHMTKAEASAVIMGPEVADKPQIASMVKTFEDDLNARIEKASKQTDNTAAPKAADAAPSKAADSAPSKAADSAPSHQ
jgi:2',3'-cyclic-nucleotide 2'-phosphodiesterase (5'-nucleotidase family)